MGQYKYFEKIDLKNPMDKTGNPSKNKVVFPNSSIKSFELLTGIVQIFTGNLNMQ